jgi:hypothetical protein
VPAKGGRLLIAHAMDQKGLIPGALLLLRGDGKMDDYHEEFGSNMNSGRFLLWFETVLLPSLDDGAVILMDNASYHGKQSEAFPKASDKLGDMREWCAKNQIDHQPYRLKTDLWAYLQLLKREHPGKYGRFAVCLYFKTSTNTNIRLTSWPSAMEKPCSGCHHITVTSIRSNSSGPNSNIMLVFATRCRWPTRRLRSPAFNKWPSKCLTQCLLRTLLIRLNIV